MPQWLTNFLKWLFASRPPVKPPVPVDPPSPVEPPPPPPLPQGKKSLWSVAINDYFSSPLAGCVNDSFHLARYLEPSGFEIHQLLERNATGPVMESFWTRAIQESGPNDVTVIHYSGHGANGPSGLPSDPGQCLVSADMKPFFASRLGGILAQADPNTTIIILLDCCHSETGSRLLGSHDYRVPRSVPWSELNTEGVIIPSHKQHRQLNPAALARSDLTPVVEYAACQANDVTWDANINGITQGCATRAWLDAAAELDPLGPYTHAQYQAQVRLLLPNADFPNQPQLLVSDGQLNNIMWRPS